ncbi:hypothetical protein LTR62_005497 [Meristemomyces frigidus]|uniref:Uncharacterized protein n=1 Tax=Meristemomyces frigidus TaxID=1508187 RepID=A0AAN7YNI8_9PEZI|nr:hypothetical protein LTR62_005497 [Meristemomyces frigidus]
MAIPYQQRGAGRSGNSYVDRSTPYTAHSIRAPQNSASLATRLNDEYRAGTASTKIHSNSSAIYASRPTIQTVNEKKMGSYTGTATLPPRQRSISGHSKLHKRAGSGASLPTPPSPMLNSQFTTPFATYEEPHTNVSPAPSSSSTPKLKPFRKMSREKSEEQGRLDLSKSTVENERLAGLGIHQLGARSSSEVLYPSTAARSGTHGRTTSGGSHGSTGSGSYKPNQPFVHPMRQTPRPYLSNTGSASTSFVNEEEADESDDLVDDDFRLGHGFRSRRSVSISSVPTIAPTPLSQSITADDLRIVPKLTCTSQTNLSIRSGKSGKSTKSKYGRSRRETRPSFDLPTTTSSRTSFDKTFSFVSRKSTDPEPQNRDERIRAARQKFEEKEAIKDRKVAKEEDKRRKLEDAKLRRQQKTSPQLPTTTTATRPKITKQNRSHTEARKDSKNDSRSDDEKVFSRNYEELRPEHPTALPRYGLEPDLSEKLHETSRASARRPAPQAGWVRFSAWWQTRMLGCGGR